MDVTTPVIVASPEPEVAEKIQEAVASGHPPIIFLDIDGVMISSTHILVDIDACWNRTFPATTIACINEVCKKTGARIVINSTHSTTCPGQPNIIAALIAHGIKGEYFHEDGLTLYPDIERRLAITEWLARHKEVTRWVAIDDCICADEPNMLLINQASGVTLDDINDLFQRWGFSIIGVLM